MKVLVLGASGMLGSAVFSVLTAKAGMQPFGTLRSERALRFFSSDSAHSLIGGFDANDPDAVAELCVRLRPEVVINCISAPRVSAAAEERLRLITIHALLPHRLWALCRLSGARLIHISSDGVFSGAKGAYTEDDPADAIDLYGRLKYLGEVEGERAITLRTSIIGRQLERSDGLLSWFLAQQGRCKGFRKAIFSGLPTVILARIICDVVIPRSELCGLYHVAAKPISKYDLLRLIAAEYGKSIAIEPDEGVVIDRSLNGERFRAATGYVAPDWPELIHSMHTYHWKGLATDVQR